jgi:hypothetical protein
VNPLPRLLDLLRQLGAQPESRERAIALAQQAAARLAKAGFSRTRQRQGQKAIAELLARQTKGAKLSYRTVLRGQLHTVVWVDDEPVAAFPPFDGELRDELGRFDTSLLVDPPEKRPKIWEAQWWTPPDKTRVWSRKRWQRDRRDKPDQPPE